jgi:hypothetical protein
MARIQMGGSEKDAANDETWLLVLTAYMWTGRTERWFTGIAKQWCVAIRRLLPFSDYQSTSGRALRYAPFESSRTFKSSQPPTTFIPGGSPSAHNARSRPTIPPRNQFLHPSLAQPTQILICSFFTVIPPRGERSRHLQRQGRFDWFGEPDEETCADGEEEQGNARDDAVVESAMDGFLKLRGGLHGCSRRSGEASQVRRDGSLGEGPTRTANWSTLRPRIQMRTKMARRRSFGSRLDAWEKVSRLSSSAT